MSKQHGGTRPGAGRAKLRRTITKDASLALRLLAWARYGRPTTHEEEDAVLSALVLEEANRVAPPRSEAEREASHAWAVKAVEEEEAQEENE